MERRKLEEKDLTFFLFKFFKMLAEYPVSGIRQNNGRISGKISIRSDPIGTYDLSIKFNKCWSQRQTDRQTQTNRQTYRPTDSRRSHL